MRVRGRAARLGVLAVLAWAVLPQSGPVLGTAVASGHLSVPASRPQSCPATPNDPNTGSAEAQTATGRVPWPAAPAGVDPTRYELYAHTPSAFPPVRPANWSGDGGDWKLTSARSGNAEIDGNPQELCGVMGSQVDRAWQVTTGRPTTLIAVLDSGIEWCQAHTVGKLYINRAALPLPEDASGRTKPQLAAAGSAFRDSDPYDLNDDGVFNAADYAADPRLARPFFCGSFVSPEDLILAFSGLGLTGPAGFTAAISGWNFVDNNNDPYDDVHYDHGSGEAGDSGGAADSSDGGVGACPNCMILPIRVGDSFIATAQNFAQAVLFGVDSGASVIQEALGTIEQTDFAQQAIDYAVAHGVPVIASAADEEAAHHNEPGSLQHTIVVNSVTHASDVNGVPVMAPRSYLMLNGCTNYGANIAVTVESASCSSEATGKGGGIAGLAESAAQDAMLAGRLRAYPGLRTVAGAPVPLSANEVQQLFTMTAGDVDFQTAAPPYGPPDNYAVAFAYPTTRFPTKPGFDQYTGYGRLDAGAVVRRIAAGDIPPEAQIDSPAWFTYFDDAQAVAVRGTVAAVRATSYRYEVQVAYGPDPAEGDWQTVASGSGSGRHTGTLATIPGSRLEALVPATAPVAGSGGRPNADQYTFTVRVVVVDDRGRVGVDRRAGYIHHDPTLLGGAPRRFDGSIDAAPTLAPIGPGGQNVLLVATAAGTVHALLPDGRELRGWPVYSAAIDGWHSGEPAFSTLRDLPPRNAIIGGLAAGDLLHDGRLEVVASDWSGRMYAWTPDGRLLPGFPVRTFEQYSTRAARDEHNRVQRGFLAAPALADLEGTGRLDIVGAAMDRHLYAWRPDGTQVPGFPVLMVDMTQVQGVAPGTDRVTFKPGSRVGQGTKMVDTPAIGMLDGTGRPDIVVGTNETYLGPVNASIADATTAALGNLPVALNNGNSRVYAVNAAGKVLPGWPFAVGDFEAGLLPVVGDGVTNSPALADVDGSGKVRVGVISTVGPAYVLNPDGTSYYGNGPDGKPIVLDLEGGGVTANSAAYPSLPSLGAPIFAPLSLGAAGAPAGASGVSFVSPASSVGKALDAAFPEQQANADTQLDAWNLGTRHFQPGFPQVMNDLEFLVQPIAANLAGDGTTYLVAGSALADVRAVDVLGRPAPGFPKFTGGWSVNSPTFGAWGGLPGQVLFDGTREGWLFAWTTGAPRCSDPGPWPRYHHDLANSNDLQAAYAARFTCGARP